MSTKKFKHTQNGGTEMAGIKATRHQGIKFYFLFCILTSVFCVLLSGCGGGGGSSSTPTTTTSTTGTITGTVSLPANTNAKLFDVKMPLYARLFTTPAYAAAITDLTKLTVKVGSATTNPSASGVYSLIVDPGTNLDLTVTTPSGNIVLEAIIPSVTAGAAASQNVDSTSTAVALIYKQNTSLTISEIASSSAVTNVKTAIETALTDSTVDSIATNSTVTSAATTAVTPALASITVSPSSVTVVSGATQTFTATGLDQFGSAISFTPAFSVSSSDIGTITSSEVFTALKTGTGTITITGGNNVSVTAFITITTGALNSLVISPTTVTLYKSDTQQFTVYGVDANGNAKVEKFITVSSPTWSVTGSIGTVDANGLFTATAQGTGQVKAQTTKSDGTAVSITADVTVSNRNPSISGPTASSSSISAGSTTTISVTASDPDSDTLTYSWTATGGTLSGTGSSVTWTPPTTAGTYTVSVTVSDGAGGSASGNVNVTVTAPNQNPVISSGPTANPSTVSTSATSTISVSASDPDGETLSYSWSATDGTVSGTGSSITFTAPSTAGTYTISVSMSDGKGGTASGSVDVTVTAPNQNPVISSGPTANPSTIITNGISTVSVTASDPDGDTLSYSWTATGGTITGSSSSVTYTAPNTAGTYTVSVTVSDGRGGSASGNVTLSVVTPKTVQKVSTGGVHACAILSDGSVKCWGDNGYGELGNGTTTSSNTPVLVSGINNATSVSVGNSHTCAVLSDGTVKCWGWDGDGQLGNGTNIGTETCSGYDCSTIPVSVSGINNATSISAGYSHTCALLSDGSVKCWGWNGVGELGNGTNIGTETCYSGNACSTTPVLVSGITTATSISTGFSHTCALLSDGSVKCWGPNGNGELGNGTDGPNAYSNTPVSVSGITNATSISAGGESHTCAVLSDGTVKCWGGNGYGELGNGTTTSSNTPVSVSGITTATSISAGRFFNTCALLSDGTIKCWGYNGLGDIGNGTTTSSDIPVLVSGITTATSISAGVATCAVLSDGTVKCWGNNTDGELGYGTGPETCGAQPCSTTPVSVDSSLYVFSPWTQFKNYVLAFGDTIKRTLGDALWN